MSVTLESVSVAPSMTRATICTSDLSDDPRWTPVAMLETNNDALNGSAPVSMSAPDADGKRCTGVMFLAAHDRTESDWTLTLERFEIPTMPDFDALKAGFAEYGIEIEALEGGGWEATYVPEDVDFMQAIDEVFRSVTETLEGPWRFTFTVPESDF